MIREHSRYKMTCLLLLAGIFCSIGAVVGHGHHEHMQEAQHWVHENFQDRPVSDLSPIKHIGSSKLKILRKRDMSHIPKGHRYHGHSEYGLQLSFVAYNQTFLLDLDPQLDVLHQNAKVFVYDGDKQEEQHLPYNLYSGKVFAGSHQHEGQAHIVLHEDELHNIDENPAYEGVLIFGDQSYTIQSAHTYTKTRREGDATLDSAIQNDHKLVIYSDKQHDSKWYQEQSIMNFNLFKRSEEPVARATKPASCSYNTTLTEGEERTGSRLYRRQSAGGCPSRRMLLYMSAAADCTYFSWYGSQSSVLKKVISNWQAASSVYEKTFNVALGLIRLEIYKSCNSNPAWNRECDASYGIDMRLNDFSSWRAQSRAGDSAGLWHLMTACASGTSLGIAWPGTICQNKVGNTVLPVLGAAVSSMGKQEWKIVAHEIGHNFGARHDCTENECRPGEDRANCCVCGSCDCRSQFIMNPTDASLTNNFSPCSISEICAVLSRAQCLVDAGAPSIIATISEDQCGNGIKEDGEQCDAGGDPGDPCCDLECRLKSNAVCSDRNDECCNQCQLASAGTVCRSPKSSCDFPEVCDGKSSACSVDKFKPDGTQCEFLGAKCASGYCTSRDQQCISRKGSLSIVGACKETVNYASCELSCQMAQGYCKTLTGYFSDGISCGYNSKCVRGECIAPNFIYATINWGVQNPAAGISVLIILIVLTIILIATCVRCICFRKPLPPGAKPTKRQGLAGTVGKIPEKISNTMNTLREKRQKKRPDNKKKPRGKPTSSMTPAAKQRFSQRARGEPRSSKRSLSPHIEPRHSHTSRQGSPPATNNYASIAGTVTYNNYDAGGGSWASAGHGSPAQQTYGYDTYNNGYDTYNQYDQYNDYEQGDLSDYNDAAAYKYGVAPIEYEYNTTNGRY